MSTGGTGPHDFVHGVLTACGGTRVSAEVGQFSRWGRGARLTRRVREEYLVYFDRNATMSGAKRRGSAGMDRRPNAAWVSPQAVKHPAPRYHQGGSGKHARLPPRSLSRDREAGASTSEADEIRGSALPRSALRQARISAPDGTRVPGGISRYASGRRRSTTSPDSRGPGRSGRIPFGSPPVPRSGRSGSARK